MLGRMDYIYISIFQPMHSGLRASKTHQSQLWYFDFFSSGIKSIYPMDSRTYIHIIYVYIGFLGQGIHYRGSFLSRGGHDHYGGHYYGGH